MKMAVGLLVGTIFGFLLGISIAFVSVTMGNIMPNIICNCSNQLNQNENRDSSIKISPASDKKGVLEKLPLGIIANESDLYLRRLWGVPSEDLSDTPKYLVTFTVGIKQKNHIDATIKKFSGNFTVLLFHYDGKTSEWDEFEWSKRAIHVSAPKQTKWWYAKRFLHPSIVSAYDYIFIWDEDLGVDNFDAEEYIRLVKKYGLDISQPALDPSAYIWEMTKRIPDQEVHKEAETAWCSHPPQPPCAGFVEVMAPVFSREAWKCVWHLIQNDLVHGWGLDFAFHKCVEPAIEKIGVVDAQWILHESIISLGDQDEAGEGYISREKVRERCASEWRLFETRMENAEKGLSTSNTTITASALDHIKTLLTNSMKKDKSVSH